MPWPGALGQAQKVELPALGVVAAFEARGGGDEQGRGAGVPGADEREVAGVVARRELLLVGGVLLLVDHDQAEVGDRREQGRAGAEHHARLAAAHPLPLLVALADAHPRMQDGEVIAEAQLDGAGEGRHERDLGHQQDRRPPAGERLLGGPQIDLGLAGAGHPLEQERRELAGLDDGGQPAEGERLILAQMNLGALPRHAHHVAVEGEALDLGELAQHAERDEPPHHGRRALDGRRDLGRGGRPAQRGQVVDHLAAGDRAPGLGEMVRDLPRRQLDGIDVARRTSPVLGGADAPPLGQGGEHRVEVRQRADPRLQLGDGHPPPLAQRLDHGGLGRSARQRERAGVGQPDLAVPPGRQVRRQHGADDLAQRSHVVVGGEARELEQVRGNHGLAVEDLDERPQIHPLGAVVHGRRRSARSAGAAR